MSTAQLLTQGITVADCQDDADATLNIRVRFPADERPLEVIFPRSGGRGQSAIRSIFGQ